MILILRFLLLLCFVFSSVFGFLSHCWYVDSFMSCVCVCVSFFSSFTFVHFVHSFRLHLSFISFFHRERTI